MQRNELLKRIEAVEGRKYKMYMLGKAFPISESGITSSLALLLMKRLTF